MSAKAKAMAYKNLLRYIFSPDCGASAKAIICRMNDIKDYSNRHPLDPSDFDRCMKLLSIFSQYRSAFHLMKDVSEEWSLLVDHWSELETLYHDGETKQLYDRMQALFDSVPCAYCGEPLKQSYSRVNGTRVHWYCKEPYQTEQEQGG